MSLHDDYARMTPFEIAFPDEGRLEDLVETVDQEASARGVDASSPGIFLTLGSVDDFVRKVLAPEAPEGAMMKYGPLVYQAVQFAGAGRPLYLLGTAATRRLVTKAPVSDPRPPTSAGYLQLPQHLFWMGGSEVGVPESVDGLFWVASPSGALHVLPIAGVLPDGPGFRALPLPEAPLADAADWLHADMRGNANDYTSALPGHDLDGLYSVETAGEVLKLLARFFAYVESTPEDREDVAALEGAGRRGSLSTGPRPSALPYVRIDLRA